MKLILYRRGEDKYSWLYALDGVCGMTSTLMFEAVVMGLPVLSLVMREGERELTPDLLQRTVKTAATRSQLRRELAVIVESSSQWKSSRAKLEHVRDSRGVLARFLLDLVSVPVL